VTAFPKDYDTDGARFAVARESATRWSTIGDVHRDVAERIQREGLTPVLDIGCGDGALRVELQPGWSWIGLDENEALLRAAGRPCAQADAVQCPIRDETCGAAAALWMLYHFDEPRDVIREAHRMLRPGGLFVACTTARDDSPELHPFFGPPDPTPFDAEEAVEILSSVFGATRVEEIRWDGPFTVLPDRAAIETYLRGRGISTGAAAEVADALETPFVVTKRGVLVWARK
jgi:SAM-dependent methyltransferase